MCWVSNNPVIFEIAEQDIKTFKVMAIDDNNNLRSYFFYSIYSIGKIKPRVTLHTQSSSNSCTHFIHRGYHSYHRNIECKYCFDIREGGVVSVGNLERYHLSFVIYSYPKLCIVECTIPKGTKYCLNERGEYVSEQIRVDKILEEY